MKDSNYITVLGWMFNIKGLKSNQVLVYALIYGFTQDGRSQFDGSLDYISKTLNITSRSVINILAQLEQMQLIVKHQKLVNNVVYNSYTLVAEKNSLGVVKKVHRGSEKSSHGGSEKISPNNTNIDNTIDIISINSKNFQFDEAVNILLKNEMNNESAAMQLKIKLSTVKKQIPVFVKHVFGIKESYTFTSDYLSHFKNWLRLQKITDLNIEEEIAWFLKMFNKVSGREFKVTAAIKKLFVVQLDNGFTGADMEKAVRNLYHPKNTWHQKTKYENATPEFLLTGDRLNKFLNARY